MVKLTAEKRSLIIAMLKDFPGRSNAEIGRQLDVAASTVLSVKKKAEAQINGEYYVQRLSKKSVIDLIKVCRDALYDRAPATTKVRDDDALQQISTHLLNRHRVKSVRFAKGSEDSAKLKKRLVNQYIWKPLKCYNHGIYLVYTRHMTKSVICKVYTWYIPVI